MALTANELVPILLGEQWLDAIFPLQILCLVGVLKSVDPLITQAFISIGKANVTARYTSLCAVIIPISVLVGAMQGTLTAVAVALAISYPLSSIYLFYSAKIHLHFSMRRYMAAIRMPIEACLWMTCWVITTAWLLEFLTIHSLLWVLLAKVLAGAVSYLMFMVHIRQQGLLDCYEVLQELGISAEKLNRWPFNKIHGRG
jgi:O-antigen/teichoic acid export membrane protein